MTKIFDLILVSNLFLSACGSPQPAQRTHLDDVRVWPFSEGYDSMINSGRFQLWGTIGNNDAGAEARTYVGGTTPEFVVAGPYLDKQASSGFAEGSIELEVTATKSGETCTFVLGPRSGPGGRLDDVCTDIDSRIPANASFVIDLSTDVGTVVRSSQTVSFTGNQARQVYNFSGFEFSGSLNKAEIRLHDIKVWGQDGKVDLKVFNTHLNLGWHP